jgi:hypothetical protein
MGHGRCIEDRVRELCALIQLAQENARAGLLLDLQTTIYEYSRRVENKTAATVLGWPRFPEERRKKKTREQILPLIEGGLL